MSDPRTAGVPTLVVVSNLGGGIRRHLDMVATVRPLEVHELPESTSLPAKVRAARGLLRASRPPLVVTHGVAAAVAVRHRGRQLGGVRHVEFWHGDPFFLSSRRRAVYRLLARTGRAPDLQVLTHRWLLPLYGDRRSPFEVLPNTVPARDAPASRLPGAVRTAVFVGRLSPEKGIADLVAAWPPDSEARGWTLDVHGSGPLDSVPLPPGVRFCGEAADPVDVLAAADLAVIPSWTETGPYSACEAMSVGTPFVGSRTGDMPEFLSSGCGWAVDPQDREGLRAALLEAQGASPEELAERGERGRRWLARHRPFAGWADAVERVYVA